MCNERVEAVVCVDKGRRYVDKDGESKVETAPVFILEPVVGGACMRWGGGGEVCLHSVFCLWDWSEGHGKVCVSFLQAKFSVWLWWRGRLW